MRAILLCAVIHNSRVQELWGRVMRVLQVHILFGVFVILTELGTGFAKGESFEAVRRSSACEVQAAAGVPTARLATLARGFNLPSWLDGGSTRRPEFSTLANLNGRGFTHIRLPVSVERLREEFSGRSDVDQQLAE